MLFNSWQAAIIYIMVVCCLLSFGVVYAPAAPPQECPNLPFQGWLAAFLRISRTDGHSVDFSHKQAVLANSFPTLPQAPDNANLIQMTVLPRSNQADEPLISLTVLHQ